MKIAVIKKDYDPNGGGAERYAANVCTGLARRGHSLTIFSETFKGEESSHFVHVKVPRSIRGFSRTSSFHRSVQSVLDRRSFDIVYALSRTYPSDIYRVTESLHKIWLGIGYPIYENFNPRHLSIIRLEKEIFKKKNTRHVVTNSELTKRQLCDNFDYPAENITVIRNGVDHDKFYSVKAGEQELLRKKYSLPSDSNVLLFVAANFRIKGLDSAIRTLRLLPENIIDKTILLVLGGDKHAKYLKLAEKHGLKKNIRFEGKKENIRDYYALSDILFYPTLYEPFANVCLEAFACGLPVLTTSMNGASEIITEAVNGYIIKSGKDLEEQMARKLSTFLGMKAGERTRFRISAYKASLDFTWENHLAGLDELMKKVQP